MERYVRFIVQHRMVVVGVVLAVTALLASQLPYLYIELHERNILPQAHPYVQLHNRIMNTFGGDITFVIGVLPKRGDIFTSSTLEKIARITRAVEQQPDVIQDSVLSIASERVKSIKASADGMDVHPLMSEVPHDVVAMERFKDEALGEKLYRGTLVAADGRAAAIVADCSGKVPYRQMVAEVAPIAARERDADTDIILGGDPIVGAAADDYTATLAILFPIALAVIALVLYEAFRTLQAIFLPLMTALLSVTWALGIIGALRQPLDVWSAVTPVVILAVAAGHAVQILKRYYEEYARIGDSAEAVVRSVTAVGPTMITAGLIASAGFGSLATFGVTSVRALGMLLAFGILSALVVEMTFTPACRAMLPRPAGREVAREKQGRILEAALERTAGLVVQRPRSVLFCAAAVVAVFATGALFLRVDNSLRNWFPENSRLLRADALFNERLAGTSTLSVLVEGASDGAIEEPDVLRAISDMEAFLEERPGIGAVTSIADYVKRMHSAMNNDAQGFYAIPSSKALVAQYLFLYSMSGPNDFISIVDPGYRQTVIRAYAKADDAAFGRNLLDALNAYVTARFKEVPVTVHVAGGSLGTDIAMNESIVREKILNLIQVTIIIFALAALALRSLIGGLIVLTPLGVGVVVNFGVMGWSHTSLSLCTAAITSCAVSIGADFAIYLIFRIREELTRRDSLEAALHASLLTSGKAIFFVSSAVALGYLVLPLSGFLAWAQLGALTALMMAVSALATLTIIPALIMTTRPKMFATSAEFGSSAGRFETKQAACG
jgi:predicted RND superfamily exporter protein